MLTCRTDEYVDAVNNADVLTAVAVIEARPLTAPAAANYLDSCLPLRQRPGWDPILDTLRRNDDTPVVIRPTRVGEAEESDARSRCRRGEN